APGPERGPVRGGSGRRARTHRKLDAQPANPYFGRLSVCACTSPPLNWGECGKSHYEERPEIEQDYEPMKSGGLQLQKLSSTRYSEIVFYVLTVVLSYSLYHLFANTQAGARFADKTRQALAFDQLRSRRTHVIAYTYCISRRNFFGGKQLRVL